MKNEPIIFKLRKIDHLFVRKRMIFRNDEHIFITANCLKVKVWITLYRGPGKKSNINVGLLEGLQQINAVPAQNVDRQIGIV